MTQPVSKYWLDHILAAKVCLDERERKNIRNTETMIKKDILRRYFIKTMNILALNIKSITTNLKKQVKISESYFSEEDGD